MSERTGKFLSLGKLTSKNMPLIEVMVQLLLPSGKSPPLRALVDTGASDDFIHPRVVEANNIPVNQSASRETVVMGTEGAQADSQGETCPIKIQSGSFCKYRNGFTILNLDEYDLILGRPFQRNSMCVISGDDVILSRERGKPVLPRWIPSREGGPQLIQLSRLEMLRETRLRKESGYLLLPIPQVSVVPDVGKPHKQFRFKRPKATPLEEAQAHGPAPDPLSSIPRAQGIPELEELLQEFKSVFPEDLPPHLPPEREVVMKIPVKPGSTPPCQAPYRTNPKSQDTIEKTIEYLVSHGLVRPSTSEYGAPVTLVPKPDGSWRFCTDYRKLNAVTQEAKYPLPRIEDCLDKLGKARYFSKIDLRSGYWQMRVHPSDVQKTAFRTQMGHYEWLVVPFGLQGAPSAFQRMMNHYLMPYLGRFVQVYLDDILIYSKTREEHLKHIRLVLAILQAKKLYAKGSKCDFFRQEVLFLGFHVKQGEIHTDLRKIEAIQDWPLPTTVRELRSFLGVCNFYRKFIEGHAKLAKPLTNILKSTEFKDKFGRDFSKTAPISLGTKEVQAVTALKQALTRAPCLVIFDYTKPTEVWADASWDNGTTGAVLMQDHGRGMQPVAFLSKVMLSAETHYPTFEQELLALKRAFQEWRHYLLPIHFTARTDHNGLKYLKTQKHLSERQWHWLAFFSEFQFDLCYRPGRHMVVPDSLSRRKTTQDLRDLLRVKDPEGDDPTFMIKLPPEEGETKERKVLLALKPVQKDPIQIPVVFDYEGDADYGEIYASLKTPSTKTPLPSHQLYGISPVGNLEWIDRSLNSRICVPKKYRHLILHEHHDTPLGGHFGMDKTYFSIRQQYIWPHMKHHVEQYVKTCDLCQKSKTYHQKKLGIPQIPELPLNPWENVTMDFCGPFPKTKDGHDMILVTICNLTRELVLIPCTSRETGASTACLFVKHVFRYKGLPKQINSDRGPQFIANFWKHVWLLLKTKVVLSSPYHPQSQALAERQNKIFLENLISFCNARQNNWDELLILYEFAYNNSIHEGLGDTPFFLNHGRVPRLPVTIQTPGSSPAAFDYVQNLNNHLQAARDHIRRMQAINADINAAKMAPANLSEGDLVLLSTINLNLKLPSEKLTAKWVGPLKVLQVRGPNSVLLEVPPRLSQIHPVQNVQYIKPYHARTPDIGPLIEHPPPTLVNNEEEFEVDEILAHRGTGNRVQYLIRFKGYGPEDDLWLPTRNLSAPDLLRDYHARQRDPESLPGPASHQRARRPLRRLGHLFLLHGTATVQVGEDVTPL